MSRTAALPGRGVIEVSGEDRVSFLQGLVSNDVALAAPGRAVWSALLTPQGKFIADFFIFAEDARLLLDAERALVPDLVARLSRYRLRARVTLRDASAEFAVRAGWDGAPPPAGITAPDPRLPEAGWRSLAPAAAANEAHGDNTEPEDGAGAAAWDLHRLRLGLPDGTRDLEPGKSILLEAGFDELGGVSWSKGCYMGQELTARTRYRGLIKRRLLPVAVEGALPPPGTPVLRDGAEAGTMRSGRDGTGLALLRIDALEGALLCGDARLTPRIPAWARLPEPA
jgi:folate-binding protein YgfZ